MFTELAVYSKNIIEASFAVIRRGVYAYFFNSESLWIGTDMKRFNQLRDVLEREGIAYRHKVKTVWDSERQRSMRGRTGSAGMSADDTYEYEILVYKRDWEKAKTYRDRVILTGSPQYCGN